MKLYKRCSNKRCKCVFDKPEFMSIGTWHQLSRCPQCRRTDTRERKSGNEYSETRLGKYEVKNKVLDRFLYKQPVTESHKLD